MCDVLYRVEERGNTCQRPSLSDAAKEAGMTPDYVKKKARLS